MPGDDQPLTMKQFDVIAELNRKREDAERRAERAYRDSLLKYSDDIRRARRVYDEAMDVADVEWRAALDGAVA